MYNNQFTGFKVYNYLRRSEREGSWKQERSIQDQEADNLALAERLGLVIVETVIEKESARTPNNRPEFNRILKELSYKNPDRRKADGILAWHPNRLSRNAQEAGLVVQMLDDEKIKNLFFPAYSFHNDTSWKEHLTIEFARAKGYSDQLSDVITRWVHNREAEGAMVYPVKFGYVKRRESDKAARSSLFPIPHPEQFEIMRRAFELAREWNSTRIIVDRLKDEYGMSWIDLPSKTALDKKLRDSFYCGQWIIKPWTKKERVINLLDIELDDGTRFQPILSVEEFQLIQKIRSWNRTNPRLMRKRTNPLPRLVTCGTCWGKMYPNYRKIKRAGWLSTEQLGYECQTKTQNGRCKQGRIKAENLFAYISENLPQRANQLSEKEYQAYVYAVFHFTKKMRDNSKVLSGKLSRSLALAKQEKSKLVLQRAELISKKGYDKHSKEVFEKRINELAEIIENLQIQKSEIGKHNSKKILSFTKFLELSENLHHYWSSANYEQKEQISKNLLSNLIVSGQEVRSGSWLKPFGKAENLTFIFNGTAWGSALEPKLEELWHRYFSIVSRDIERNLNILSSDLSLALNPKYPLIKDIAQITGT